MGIIRDRMAVDLRLAGYSACTRKNYLTNDILTVSTLPPASSLAK